MFTLPGAPVLRYGDEIGMGDDLTLPERYCARTPMQWSSERHGGFTKARHPVLPVISSGEYGYQHVNVAAQRRDAKSLLSWFERIMRMRKEIPEIGWGTLHLIEATDPAVLATRYDWQESSVLFLHNLADTSREVFFRASPEHGRGGHPIDLLDDNHSQAGQGGRHCVLLEAYGYRWFRLDDPDYARTTTQA